MFFYCINVIVVSRLLWIKPRMEGITSDLKAKEYNYRWNKLNQEQIRPKDICYTTAGTVVTFWLIAALAMWLNHVALSENHQEKTKKEVVIPTKDTIHQVLSDSIMNQEDIDKEEWQQEWEQQWLSPQEIEE